MKTATELSWLAMLLLMIYFLFKNIEGFGALLMREDMSGIALLPLLGACVYTSVKLWPFRSNPTTLWEHLLPYVMPWISGFLLLATINGAANHSDLAEDGSRLLYLQDLAQNGRIGKAVELLKEPADDIDVPETFESKP